MQEGSFIRRAPYSKRAWKTHYKPLGMLVLQRRIAKLTVVPIHYRFCHPFLSNLVCQNGAWMEAGDLGLRGILLVCKLLDEQGPRCLGQGIRRQVCGASGIMDGTR